MATSMTTAAKAHHYVIDAASLLETCLTRLRETIELDYHKRHSSLLDVEGALVTTERLLQAYIVQLIDLERETVAVNVNTDSALEPPTLAESTNALRLVLEVKKECPQAHQVSHARRSKNLARNKKKNVSVSFAVGSAPHGDIDQAREETMGSKNQSAGDSTGGPIRPRFCRSRSATDSLLFHLIVALQLCLVRIDDARFVITGRRYRDEQTSLAIERQWSTRTITIGVASSICVLGIGSVWMFRSKQKSQPQLNGFLRFSRNATVAALVGKLIVREWGSMWMSTKIMKSTAAIEDWQQQWLLVQSTREAPSDSLTAPEVKSQRLIEYALNQSPKSSLWHSEGEIRFLLLKRAMDLLYASVGTAVEVTKNASSTKEGGASWKMPLAAAAAASYYSLTGPSRRASEVVSSSSLALIQYAWGMVSMPAIKQLSLNASRILKGAAIAERVTIAGFPCFILSRDSSPELAAALRRSERRKRRSMEIQLPTIDEKSSGESTSSRASKPIRANHRYPKKDVIFHLTGGGFFAHTIASDLPFLLDWSGKTNAVVICPEYSLLPEHTFPVALDEVTGLYCSLVSGESSDLLGIDVNRVIVTGESAGGNLAAAMCVKLCFDNLVDGEAILASKQSQGDRLSDSAPPLDRTIELSSVKLEQMDAEDYETTLPGEANHETDPAKIRLPNAIMLSCPALNLSLELSPSRIHGVDDPVLPSGLISAISDAYIPPALGVSKKDPLASPFYAPDDVLRLFPPTLLFASSDDPLLDDSIDFNERLRCLGVESELRAACHMPHAFWGLGTAGFPEAQEAQHECEEWLVRQLSRNKTVEK